MTQIIPTDLTRCAACGRKTKPSRRLCLYMVGTITALAHTLCNTCGKASKNGYTPAMEQSVSKRMEALAIKFGVA